MRADEAGLLILCAAVLCAVAVWLVGPARALGTITVVSPAGTVTGVGSLDLGSGGTVSVADERGNVYRVRDWQMIERVSKDG